VAAAGPETREDRKNAHFRLAAVLAEIGEYSESNRTLGAVLAWDDLAPEERLEALARLGFAFLQLADHAAAEEILRSGLAYHRQVQGTTRLETPYFVAMAQFYLAEIPHQQFAAIPLRYPEEQMRRDLEQKSHLFLLARDRYVKTVEYRSPYWATAAVFQIASMYKEFWDHWMAVPVPRGFDEEETREYVRRVNEEPELRRLLEKALYFHEKNVQLSRDAKVSTGWSQQSAVEAAALRELLKRLGRGEHVMPGTVAAARPVSAPPMRGSTPAPAGEAHVPPRMDL
jgi:hypothetical protein